MSARGALAALLVVAGCGRFDFDPTLDAAPGQAPSCAVTSAAVGKRHTCALRGDGSVWCWGGNDDSQLAQPKSGPSLVAVPITLPQPATSIAGGAEHTC